MVVKQQPAKMLSCNTVRFLFTDQLFVWQINLGLTHRTSFQCNSAETAYDVFSNQRKSLTLLPGI